MKVYKGNPRNMRKRLPELITRKTCKKSRFKCVDGPLEGHTLMLTDGFTAVFTIAGNTGRYNNGVWERC